MGSNNNQNHLLELMRAINKCAELLLEADVKDQQSAMTQGMKMLGEIVDVNRVTVWKNYTLDDGRLYYKLVCDWASEGVRKLDSETFFAYEDWMPSWEDKFIRGESVNGPVESLLEIEYVQLNVFGLKSILAIPIFHKDKLWGFVSFDDYNHKRHFPEEETSILHSWGLLVVGAIQRGEITMEMHNALNELEVALEKAQTASRAKTAFLTNMSHEIRTPLNAILGITEIQLFNEKLERNVREAFNKIYISGDMLLNIINDLLDLSKIESEKLEIIDAKYDTASLISDIAQLNIMRIGSKPIEFEISIDENLPTHFIGDELRIKQILNNILTNAFKYTDEGKVKLSVSAESSENDDKDSYMLIFSVSDTGQGMTKEEIDMLFEEYSRFNLEANRKTEGAGLGMSITDNLIRMMNGEINVESQPGIGSTFTFYIPQLKAGDNVLGKETVENLQNFRTADGTLVRQVDIKRKSMSSGSVLVVDDVETNVFVMIGLLEPYGLNIDSASDGFEAVEKIAAGNTYDIIFMDHMMPNMDGLEATRIIREMGYDKPIVALTANAVTGQAETFLKSGFDEFISKPIDIYLLNSVLNRLIRDK